MLKSWVSDPEKAEFEAIREPEHMAAVWEDIRKSFPKYFASLVKPRVAEGEDLLEQLKANAAFRVRAPKKPKAPPKPDFSALSNAVTTYEREAEHYREFFDPERLAEFREDDPDAFKTELSKKCPVIRQTLMSPLEDLKEWKYKYKAAKSATLLAAFDHLRALGDGYLADSGAEPEFDRYDDPDDFAMEDFNEETTGVPGVVGGGIKTAVLYHLEPRVFAPRSTSALFGLYFLTEEKTYRLKSKTSEFIMVDDKRPGRDEGWSNRYNMKVSQNYWYPYELFAFYAMKIWRLLRDACAEKGHPLEPAFRFVFVLAFLDHVCRENDAAMKVLKGIDELSSYAHG